MADQTTRCLGMQPEHCKRILENVEQLVNRTDYKILSDACLTNRLLNRAMLNKIEAVSGLDGEALQRERHRRLFIKLTKRGPNAFQTLENILVQKGYKSALDILKNDEGHQSLRQKNILLAAAQIMDNDVQVAKTDPNNTSIEGLCISRIDENESNDDFILQPYDKEIKPRNINIHNITKSEKLHQINESDKLGVYPMKSQHNRGVLLVINIIEFVEDKKYRNGAKEDTESLLYVFKALGFTLFTFENLNSNNFKDRIQKIIHSEYTRNAECFVMALMTHGTEDGNHVEKIELSDGAVIEVKEILSWFYNDACSNLVNKPKIFLFPFCRGHIHDLGYRAEIQANSVATNPPYNGTDDVGRGDLDYRAKTQSDGHVTGPPRVLKVGNEQRVRDILVCYATLRGHRAYRDDKNGSWYIQCFCENIAKHAHHAHFENILKMIQNDNSQRRSEYGTMQAPNYNNLSFNKKLYFNPGVYEKVDKSS